jgi:hypothetical protein
MKGRVIWGALITGVTGMMLCACDAGQGQGFDSVSSAPQSARQTHPHIMLQTYKVQKAGTQYQLQLGADKRFVDRTLTQSTHKITVRSGQYRLNKTKMVATLIPTKVANATFESKAALKTARAPVAVNISARLTGDQREAAKLTVHGQQYRYGQDKASTSDATLQTVGEFYQKQHRNYLATYGRVEGLNFRASAGDGYSGEIVFNAQRFRWFGSYSGNGGQTNQSFAEGSYRYDSQQEALLLHITAKSPLYQGVNPYMDNQFSYYGTKASMFGQDDVTMKVKMMAGRVTFSTTTPNLGQYEVSGDKIDILAVADVKKRMVRHETLESMFPTADDFADFVRAHDSGILDTDPKPIDDIDFQYLDESTNDVQDDQAVYMVEGTQESGDHLMLRTIHVAIDGDGTVYVGSPGMLSMSPELTALVRSKLGN